MLFRLCVRLRRTTIYSWSTGKQGQPQQNSGIQSAIKIQFQMGILIEGKSLVWQYSMALHLQFWQNNNILWLQKKSRLRWNSSLMIRRRNFFVSFFFFFLFLLLLKWKDRNRRSRRNTRAVFKHIDANENWNVNASCNVFAWSIFFLCVIITCRWMENNSIINL